MYDVNLEVKGTKLIITVGLPKCHRKSASGKSVMIASTEGNVPVERGYPRVFIGGKSVKGGEVMNFRVYCDFEIEADSLEEAKIEVAMDCGFDFYEAHIIVEEAKDEYV
ncbi:MAG: hypothetical protein KJ556_20190 [Gammaproteobacteria bacterium]|nr:hypothetical protein [Gammaproteobacteria bacterium]